MCNTLRRNLFRSDQLRSDQLRSDELLHDRLLRDRLRGDRLRRDQLHDRLRQRASAGAIVRAAATVALVAALTGAGACSDGSSVGLLGNPNAVDPLSADGVPPGADSADLPAAPAGAGAGLPGGAPGNTGSDVPAAGAAPPPQGETPGSLPSASDAEPEPTATETNFFGVGCRKDADCGENRRCEFPDAGGSGTAAPEADGGVPAESAEAGPPLLIGRCVAR